jgi:SH3-like domain-containing protein
MRARTEIVLSVLAGAAMVAATAPAIVASMRGPAPEQLFVKAYELNVRERPDSDVIGWLSCGDKIEVVASDGEWLEGRSIRSDRTGWLHRDYLSAVEPSCVAACVCDTDRDPTGEPCGFESRQARTGGVLLSCVPADPVS